MKRSVALLGVMFAALLTMAATKTVRNVPTQVVEVCLTPNCKYSTIASALAAITDSSSSKRYTVEIGPGTYTESVTAVSYVTLKGSGRSVTRLVWPEDGSGTDTLTIPETVVEFAISGMEIAAPSSQSIITAVTRPSSRRTIRIDNCIIGSNTSSSTAQDPILDAGGNTTWYVTDTIFRSSDDTIKMQSGGADTTFIGSGLRFELTAARGSGQAVFNINAVGTQIYLSNSTASVVMNNALINQWDFMLFNGGTGTDTQPIIIDLNGVNIEMDQAYDAAGNPALGCFRISGLNAPSVTTPVPVFRATGVNCRVTQADASGTVRGLLIGSDADLANWDISWTGGKIALGGSGGTKRGIDNTQASTTVKIRALNNDSGNVATGPILVDDSADLTAGSCQRGQTFVDTGGATVEFCVCGTTNTWGCWTLNGGAPGTFNANGPTD